MSAADVNSSINNLIGTFATINTGTYQPIPNNLVCIDTSNNRIGVNTIDPSYGIHVIGSDNDGTIGSKSLRISNDSNTVIIFDNLPTSNQNLERGQLYNDGGTLKIA
tara:strand:+ start:2455 stop:2775 length:321 start_codon:yes stop_codon:yes gene_type:complete